MKKETKKEPKNSQEDKGCDGCGHKGIFGKGWCYFWKLKPRDVMPCWRHTGKVNKE